MCFTPWSCRDGFDCLPFFFPGLQRMLYPTLQGLVRELGAHVLFGCEEGVLTIDAAG